MAVWPVTGTVVLVPESEVTRELSGSLWRWCGAFGGSVASDVLPAESNVTSGVTYGWFSRQTGTLSGSAGPVNVFAWT